MSVFSRGRPREARLENSVSDATSSPPQESDPDEVIAGDRGIPSINRARSIQSRVSQVLAIGLMSVLGFGLLTWYYVKALTRPGEARHAAQVAVKNRAQGEMALPKLPHVESPFAHQERAPEPSELSVSDSSPTVETLLGPAPPAPNGAPMVVYGSPPPPGAGGATPQKSPAQLAFERRLAGPAFAHASGEGAAAAMPAPAQAAELGAFAASRAHGGEEGGDALAGLLRPTVAPAVAASVLPTRRFLLAKGTFIDCTLETAIDSTLPGMTTCVTATDTFSADGSVVLLERGTKLVGETRGQVAQGTSRIFVLWTEARTPTGVVVPLSSPGTDELGRSGLSGNVNRHFWDRFGAAILLTVINGVVQGAVASQNQGSSVIVSPSTTSDVMTEVLKSTVNIPPTVNKAQGDRIQVFVARDVDFRPVYALEAANAAQSGRAP
jgi:type IV secretion system protein VirB10